jgi:diguanylate cyclase (GGDEF)-like protein
MAGFVTGMSALMHSSGIRQGDAFAMLQVWSTIAMTNVLGIAISCRFYTLRCRQFLGHLELERVRDELLAIAATDSLTGLLTRRRTLELAEEDLSRARRYDRPLSVLAIDLDHFKQINDRYGHAAGDVVLIGVAQVLREQTREHDRVGRIGGEELTIVLPETGAKAAGQLARRIRAFVSGLRSQVDGVEIRVTVSVGVAEAHADDTSILDVLKRADHALYRAKEQGRDRVVAA